MAHPAPRDFNLKLCAILGLDPTKVRSITLQARHDAPVIIEAEMLVPLDEAGELLATLRRYKLALIETEE